MGQIVEFPSNGTHGIGYLAAPASGSGPGVVVIQEWWGLNDHIRAIAERFAAAGFVALAPDLYRGEVALAPDEARRLAMNLDMQRAAKDMSGAVDFVADRSNHPVRVGVVGFCMGGGLALALAALRPDKVGAVAPFYGLPRDPSLDWNGLSASVQGHYGELDSGVPLDDVRAFMAKLEALGKSTEVHVYGGAGHAFFNDQGKNFKPDAAKLAWDRTLEFLRSKLA